MAVALTAAVVPGFRIRGFGSALIAALLIGVVNYFLRGILDFFTFPFYILTLGFFRFVVDAIILRIAAAFLDDFEISGWISAILGAVILAIASSALHYLLI